MTMDKGKHPRAYEDVLRTTVSAVHVEFSPQGGVQLRLDDGPATIPTHAAMRALAATIRAALMHSERREGGGQ